MPTENEKKIMITMIGRKALNWNNLCVAVSDYFPDDKVHYELYQNHIELHLEPTNNLIEIKYLTDYLKKHLNKFAEGKEVQRDFCYYAYQLNNVILGWSNLEELANAHLRLRSIVEPLVVEYLKNMASKLDIINELASYYDSMTNLQPYHINVIDELHANENAHTRILVKLLNYSREKNFPILQSFLNLLPTWDRSIEIGNPSISFNTEFIDGLIECKGKYAIIIENKIHGAKDQNKQLETYVNNVINHGIPKDCIWLIYLTRDGFKTPINESLTKETKMILEDRYVPLDYQHHIIPWLKNEVLTNCRVKEDYMISALKQYIDHLEGMFKIREYDAFVNNAIIKKLSELSGLSDNNNLIDKLDAFNDWNNNISAIGQIVQNELHHIKNTIIKPFETISNEYFSNKYPGREFFYGNYTDNGYYQIRPKDWNQYIHLEWIPLNIEMLVENNNLLTIVLHIENQKDPFIYRLVNSLLFSKEYKEKNTDEKIDSTTFYKYTHMLNNPFVSMTKTEMKQVLFEMYKKMQWVVDLVDEIIAKTANSDATL